MPRFVPFLLGTLIAVMLIGVPVGFAHYRRSNVRNFRVVREHVLYRSGQMSLAGLKWVEQEYGIRTVITLRDAVSPEDPPPDLAEEKYCAAAGLNYCRISPRTWWAPDGVIPAEEGVRRFRAIMDDPNNYPVLIHCFGGIHRTGAFCAIYRMEYEHWSNERAIAEMRACGYKDLEDEWDLLDFLQQYQPSWRKDGPEPVLNRGAGFKPAGRPGRLPHS
jgi:tyrosine-protein phosphatase SIW14